jgi:hypothetical protein
MRRDPGVSTRALRPRSSHHDMARARRARHSDRDRARSKAIGGVDTGRCRGSSQSGEASKEGTVPWGLAMKPRQLSLALLAEDDPRITAAPSDAALCSECGYGRELSMGASRAVCRAFRRQPSKPGKIEPRQRPGRRPRPLVRRSPYQIEARPRAAARLLRRLGNQTRRPQRTRSPRRRKRSRRLASAAGRVVRRSRLRRLRSIITHGTAVATIANRASSKAGRKQDASRRPNNSRRRSSGVRFRTVARRTGAPSAIGRNETRRPFTPVPHSARPSVRAS